MNIGTVLVNIDKRLKELNISKMTFYKESGVTSGAVSQWKTGKSRPSTESLERIASYLKITYEELVLEQKEKPTPDKGELDIGELSEKEMKIIRMYRSLPELDRAEYFGYLQGLSKSR